MQSGLVMYPIHTYGSEAQKEKWLPRMQQGKAIGCFGLTEPQFGSNPSGMLRRAVKKGDRLRSEWRKDVDHQRFHRGRGAYLGKVRRRRIRGFLIERGTPGFKAWDIHGKQSLRASVTSGLAMTDCRIPAQNVLPGVKGMKGALSCLTQAR